MRRRPSPALLAILAGLLVAGCRLAPVDHGLFVYAGEWDPPPAFHGNPWTPGGNNAATGFVYEPLFVYVPGVQQFVPRLGASYTASTDRRTLTVHLQPGARWQDGTLVTSQDVRTTFYVGYLEGMAEWNALEDVTCPAPDVVEFHWRRITPTNTIRALTELITSPAHLYGTWARQVPALLAGRDADGYEKMTPEGEQVRHDIRESLLRFHPPLPMGTGPYVLQRATASYLTLTRFEQHYQAAQIHVPRVRILRWGSNSIVWTYLMAGVLDAATPACPYDVAEEILHRRPGMRLITAPDLSDFGLAFNCAGRVTARQALRQAIACILDRDQIRQISFFYGRTSAYTLGLPDSFAVRWLGQPFLDALPRWDHDPARAAGLLERDGCRRDARGQWHTPEGTRIQLSIVAPAGQNDVVLLAEAAATQLNHAGIATEVRVVPMELYGLLLANHDFDLAAASGAQLLKFDTPGVALARFYDPDGELAQATGLPAALTVDGHPIDTGLTARALARDLPPAETRRLTQQLARVTQEYVPYLSCYEKNMTIFTLEGTRVRGSPAPDDPIWKAAPTGIEGLMATLLVQGRLWPVAP